MKQQVFITSRERLNPRWQEAFDDADYCLHANFPAYQVIAESSVFWLDISRLATEARLPLLQQVVGKVDKLMVMTDQQSDLEAMQVMQSGAAGYCHYLAAPEQLREIATVVSRGGLWIGAKLMQKLLSVSAMAKVEVQRQPEPGIEKQLEQLTPRERMVAVEVGKGATNKEIAETLTITERTVKAHVSVIFNKLDVRDRVKLALLINKL